MEPSKKRKRPRKDNPNKDDGKMDIDDELEEEEHDSEINIDKIDKGTSEIINVEFVFSNVTEDNFHSVKNLIKPLFEFEDINPSDLFDIILSQHEDVGTTIKTENDDEKNVFGIFSYIPLTYYITSNPSSNKTNLTFINKYMKFLNKKLTNNNKFLDIINNKSNAVALLVNERAMNLPEETIAPALGMITKEIFECKEFSDYDKKFDFDYLIVMSKFVKVLSGCNKVKTGKKVRHVEAYGDDVAYYKWEYPLFLRKAIASIEYKIQYKENNMEMIENKNEPQYISIAVIKGEDYFDVLKKELKCEW